MKLGVRIDSSKPVQILDKKTENGYAFYQIKWVSKGNQVEWVPLRSLQNYLSYIDQYERKNPQPKVEWDLQALHIGREDEMKQQQRKERGSVESLPQKKMGRNVSWEEQYYFHNQKRRKWLPESLKNKFFRVGLPHIMLKKLKRKKASVYKLKGFLKIKHTKQTHKKREEIVEDPEKEYSFVRNIFYERGQWIAEVVLVNSEVIRVLRDHLRISNPLILLKYYEEMYKIQKEKGYDCLEY